MSGHRKAQRAAVRAAIEAAPAFAAWAGDLPWGQPIEGQDLPAFGVFVRRDIKRPEGVGSFRFETDLVVLLRLRGGDGIEDQMDDAADAAEAAILPALDAIADDAELETIDFDIPGSGEARIGTVALTFRVITLA